MWIKRNEDGKLELAETNFSKSEVIRRRDSDVYINSSRVSSVSLAMSVASAITAFVALAANMWVLFDIIFG